MNFEHSGVNFQKCVRRRDWLKVNSKIVQFDVILSSVTKNFFKILEAVESVFSVPVEFFCKKVNFQVISSLYELSHIRRCDLSKVNFQFCLFKNFRNKYAIRFENFNTIQTQFRVGYFRFVNF